MASMSNYLENKIIDWLLRGQSFTPPTNVYVGLYTAAPSDAAGGTEVTGGSYARQAVSSALTSWAGTQSAGSTTASTGTSGTTSNNAVITFPTPTADWGTCTHLGIWDASTSGNLLFWNSLASSRTVNSGDGALSIPISNLSIQIDN